MRAEDDNSGASKRQTPGNPEYCQPLARVWPLSRPMPPDIDFPNEKTPHESGVCGRLLDHGIPPQERIDGIVALERPRRSVRALIGLKTLTLIYIDLPAKDSCSVENRILATSNGLSTFQVTSTKSREWPTTGVNTGRSSATATPTSGGPGGCIENLRATGYRQSWYGTLSPHFPDELPDFGTRFAPIL